MSIISMRNVSKFFGEFQALKDVSLNVIAGVRWLERRLKASET